MEELTGDLILEQMRRDYGRSAFGRLILLLLPAAAMGVSAYLRGIKDPVTIILAVLTAAALIFFMFGLYRVIFIEKHPLIVCFHHRQRIQLVEDPAPLFAGEIAVFDLAEVDGGVPEEQLAVTLQCADVVGILMGDEDMPDGGGINVQPAHFLLQTFIVVTRVDHNRHTVLCVKEDIGNPLPHAGHTLVDAAGVQRLENGPAAEQLAHGFLLVFRILPCHFSASSYYGFPIPGGSFVSCL